MTETKWDLFFDTYVDNGELDGVDTEAAFVLGAEWQALCNELETGKPFFVLAHQENRDRYIKVISDNGRESRYQSWGGFVYFEVADRMGRFPVS
jgi:hypothetical protein